MDDNNGAAIIAIFISDIIALIAVIVIVAIC